MRRWVVVSYVVNSAMRSFIGLQITAATTTTGVTVLQRFSRRTPGGRVLMVFGLPVLVSGT
jgi:hypothetical protein